MDFQEISSEPSAGYTIEYRKRGMVVIGSIPASDFTLVAELAEKRNYDLMFPGIASALGVGWVFSNKNLGEAWQKEINDNAKAVRDWIHSADTGISSRAIYFTLKGKYNSDAAYEQSNIPRDADDFGRCYRLLTDWFPEWRARLPEVAAKYPAWEPLVREWDNLSAMYEAGKLDAIYDALTAMEGK